MFCAGIVVVVALWLPLRITRPYGPHELAVVFFAGIFALLIIRQLIKMMNTVVAKNCFVYENVASLKIMGRYSFIISLSFIVLVFFRFTPPPAIIVFTFFVAGLFCYVLAHVFEEAIKYKEENELTI
jgi:predicted tellurium resistance membrane protein TerC